MIAVSIVLAVIVCGLVAWILSLKGSNAELKTSNSRLENDNAALAESKLKLESDNAALAESNRGLEIDNARLSERIELIQKQAEVDDEQRREAFKAIAADVLQSNSTTLAEQSRLQLAELIAPMKSNLEEFRKSYTEAYMKENEKHALLDRQLHELFDVNRTIGEEARRLSDALKGNSNVQGQWGELVLENILERTGLVKGQDYFVQQVLDSRMRPDVVITCPGERNIVVDSKVSLSDYMRMLSAADRAEAKKFGEAHVASVRKHVAELRRKNYQDQLNGRNADFVMMFIPHEGAYIAAMQLDNELWQMAFDSRVVIVSPTHLVSVLKLVEMMWRQDKQNRNALEIAEIGGKMLDKLANFITEMGKVRSSLDAAGKAYDSAMVKLDGRGGIRSLGEAMRDRGIKGSRELPARD